MSTPGLARSGSRNEVEFSSVMPSSARTFATAPSKESVLRVRRDSSSLARRQSGLMLEKICLCLTCPAMIGAMYAFPLEGLNQLGKFAQRQPMNEAAPLVLDLGGRFFLNGCDDNVEALRARSVENQEREIFHSRR